jgi:uncharacterized lipoprotein YajG
MRLAQLTPRGLTMAKRIIALVAAAMLLAACATQSARIDTQQASIGADGLKSRSSE